MWKFSPRIVKLGPSCCLLINNRQKLSGMKKNVPKRATKKSAKAELSGFPIVGIGASASGFLSLAHEDALATIETMPIPLLIITAGLKVKLANQAFYEKFQVSRNETEGRLLSDLGNGQWNNPALL